MSPLEAAVVSEAPRFVSGLVLLTLGWFVGQRLSARWNLRQKRRELELSTAREFHELYGDFFATWKLWNYYNVKGLIGPAELPGASRWEILKRAAISEGRLEAMLVRLCCDHRLEPEQRATLRDFRELYQQLRKAIKEDKSLLWGSSGDHQSYQKFKRLAPAVAALAGREAGPRLRRDEAEGALCDITNPRPEGHLEGGGWPLTHRFTDALTYATERHVGQFRKGTSIPYVAHLLAVCALVLEDGGSEDEAIAALLHDTVEDTAKGTGGQWVLDEIRSRFGGRVADIVGACTESWACSATDRTQKPSWEERKQKHIDHLREAGPEVMRVSAADKVHNASAILRDYRTLGEQVWERFNRGRDAQLRYYGQLVDAFRRPDRSALAEELERVVSELATVSGRGSV